MTKDALIVFLKNPVKGKVKTRLARKIGDAAALKIYIRLIEGIKKATSKISADIHLFYSDQAVDADTWEHIPAGRWLQQGGDIGKRMAHAFNTMFDSGYEKVILIGSDLWDLQASDILYGFYQLEANDIVFGPAADGGYYLIGMKSKHPEVFELETWSHENVFQQSLEKCRGHDLSVSFTRVLRDIDKPEDLEGTGLDESL